MFLDGNNLMQLTQEIDAEVQIEPNFWILVMQLWAK